MAEARNLGDFTPWVGRAASLEALSQENAVNLAARLALKLTWEKQQALPQVLKRALEERIAQMYQSECSRVPGDTVVLYEDPQRKLRAAPLQPGQEERLEEVAVMVGGASLWLVREPVQT